MQYVCCTTNRRDLVLAHPMLNGIDFLEVVDSPAQPLEERQRTLRLRFLKSDALATLAPANIQIDGGERVRGIHADQVAPDASDPLMLEIHTTAAGDFSSYTLRLVSAPGETNPPAGFDPVLAVVTFSFKVACPAEFDCAQEESCPPGETASWDVNYLARDYASFRRLMLDRMAALAPEWRERNPADMGVALVELLAYIGDRLSYSQDAIATEAYLGTARSRVSVRRHARLLDYRMHDGANAAAWVQVRLDPAAAPETGLVLEPLDALGARTRLLSGCPAPAKLPDAEFSRVLNEYAPEVFELPQRTVLYREHNELRFYTWGDANCCLPQGATSATLRDDAAARLRLRPGDVLVFAERLNPHTGGTAEQRGQLDVLQEDADRSKRQAVRLTRVSPEASLVLEDGREIDRTPGDLQADPLTDEAIVEIEWAAADALAFPLCVSATSDESHGKQALADVSVALGNIVLADHGRTISGEALGSVPEPLLFAPAETSGHCAPTERTALPPRFRPRLAERPLTQASSYDTAASAFSLGLRNPADALPQILLESSSGAAEPAERWRPAHDLLNSQPESRAFVVEIERDGAAFIRFGDDTHGQRPNSGTAFHATYRVGNGAAGNVAAEAIRHLVASAAVRGAVERVRNPMAASGGCEPESIEDVRQRAPSAFRTQQRAVTTADYAARAEQTPGVQRAAASYRWTGSWRTVFITADRFGGAAVDPTFEQDVRGVIEPFRMAGQDVEIDTPRLVSLEITLDVCVQPGYFRSDVKRALLDVFGRRGFFNPDSFSFGQPVYLSQIYAAAQAVAGVASVQVTQFARMGQPDPAAFANGLLPMARSEIARCDNDPNFPDRGVLRLQMRGGL